MKSLDSAAEEVRKTEAFLRAQMGQQASPSSSIRQPSSANAVAASTASSALTLNWAMQLRHDIS